MEHAEGGRTRGIAKKRVPEKIKDKSRKERTLHRNGKSTLTIMKAKAAKVKGAKQDQLYQTKGMCVTGLLGGETYS